MKFDNGKLVITFDDSDINLYTVYHILKELKIIATFYINTGWIGKENQLTWDHIKEMAKEMDIECHTHNHYDLTKLSKTEILKEFINVNKSFKKNNLQKPLHTAYPWGHINNTVIEIAGRLRKTGRTAYYGTDIEKDTYKMTFSAYEIDNMDLKGIIKLKKKLIEIQKNKLAIILFAHGITDQGEHIKSISKKMFYSIINFAKSLCFDIISIDELYKVK
jgi:peptidoglycan/xylan/chitin deacetylase (PgdA/CDA1 family)